MTTPASADRKEIIDRAIEASREKALEKAGKAEAKVSEVKNIQRQELSGLLYGKAKGTDGATAGGEDLKLEPEAEAAIEKDHEERMTAVEAAPDATVFERIDETAGVQNDGDRSIGIAHDILLDKKATTNVALHEGEHAKQEVGAQVAAIPETGNATIDKGQGKLRRLGFREDLSIKAEGGLKDHTPEYHGFVATTDATREYLNEAGMDGDRLVHDAGRTVRGFEEMHHSLLQAVMQKRVEESGIPAFSAN